jgi:penicillin-binding protein 1A
VFLGASSYGVRAAARAYFDRELDELTAAQAAMIAGLAQAPGRADPFKNPAVARARRDEVLDRMQRAGFLDEAVVAAARAEPLDLRPPDRPRLAPWYTEHVRRLLEDSLPEMVDLGGLEVETAADPALAALAEDRLRKHVRDRWKKHPPEAAALLWDHTTGYVEALVGGKTWSTEANQFDRMIQACRQPGSAWKPILYGAALASDAITLGTPLRDAPVTEYDEATNTFYRPKSGKRFRGVVLARNAFASSLNAPAIDVLHHVGAQAVIGFARRLGISTEIATVDPMALGASCVRPFELARAFAVFARRGWAIAPRFVVRVRRGEDLLFDAAVPEDPWLDPARRLDRVAALAGLDPDERIGVEDSNGPLVDERTAFLVEELLASVVKRGTATAARGLGRPAAGKTGTVKTPVADKYQNIDAWFIGFTARVLGAVWVGHDDPSELLGSDDDGAHAALPLWMSLIRLTEGDRPARPVPGTPPPGLERARIDTETGLLAAPGAGGGDDLWFKQGTAPTEVAGRVTGSGTDFGRTAHEF